MVRSMFGHHDPGTPSAARSVGSARPRWWQAVAGAVAVVLVGVAAFAVVALTSTSKRSTNVTNANLTSHSGPDHRGRGAFVAGTVASVDGASFTVTEKGSSSPKSVTTSTNTVFTLTAPGTVASAVVGSSVVAVGTRQSGGTLLAVDLAVLPARPGGGSGSGSGASGSPWGSSSQFKGGVNGLTRLPFAFGTVTANNGGTLTVASPFGTQAVSTNASTKVTVTSVASLAAVTTGATVQAAGIQDSGTLDARVVHIGPATLGLEPAGFTGGFGGGAGGTPGGTTTTTGTGASTSTTVTTVAGSAGGSGGSGGTGTSAGAGSSHGRPAAVIGTVASVSGSGFTVTARGVGSTTTVTTSSSTQFSATGPGTVADAGVGSVILGSGTPEANGVLSAAKLVILPAVQKGSLTAGAKLSPSTPLSGLLGLPSLPNLASGLPFVFGTVTANSGGTVTVSTPFGSETVTTTGSTSVTDTKTASLSAVSVGASVQVFGLQQRDGSIAATVVHVGSATLGLTVGDTGRHR